MTSPWIQKSIEIVNSPGYLDKLSQIYEMQINPLRPLSNEVIPKLKQAFESKNHKELIKLLIYYGEIFPVKDSYVGFIKAKPQALDENPETMKRIGERILSLKFEGMLREATRPIETNRQLGASFKNWSINELGYKSVDTFQEFIKNNDDTTILKGSDTVLKMFAEKTLKCELRKGIDFIIKKRKTFIVGEAKFLTTPGGEQDRGFEDALSFVNNDTGNALRVAIIDGYIWLNKYVRDDIKKSEKNIMSALLLKEFIDSL